MEIIRKIVTWRMVDPIDYSYAIYESAFTTAAATPFEQTTTGSPELAALTTAATRRHKPDQVFFQTRIKAVMRGGGGITWQATKSIIGHKRKRV